MILKREGELAINCHLSITIEGEKTKFMKQTMLARKRRMEIIRQRAASKNHFKGASQMQQLKLNHCSNTFQDLVNSRNDISCDFEENCKLCMLQPQEEKYDNSLSMFSENNVLPLNSKRSNHSTSKNSLDRFLPSPILPPTVPSSLSLVSSSSSSSSSSLLSSSVVVGGSNFNNTDVVKAPKKKVPPFKKTEPKKKKYKRYIPTGDGARKMSREELRQWRKEQRMVRNRQSAAVSRMKIRNRITDLESDFVALSTKYRSALKRISELTSLLTQKEQKQQPQQMEMIVLDDSMPHSLNLSTLSRQGEENSGKGYNKNQEEKRVKTTVTNSKDNAMHIITNFRSNAWIQRKISKKFFDKILTTQ